MGPEIEAFLRPEMATRAASDIWAQKSRVIFLGEEGLFEMFVHEDR